MPGTPSARHIPRVPGKQRLVLQLGLWSPRKGAQEGNAQVSVHTPGNRSWAPVRSASLRGGSWQGPKGAQPGALRGRGQDARFADEDTEAWELSNLLLSRGGIGTRSGCEDHRAALGGPEVLSALSGAPSVLRAAQLVPSAGGWSLGAHNPLPRDTPSPPCVSALPSLGHLPASLTGLRAPRGQGLHLLLSGSLRKLGT